MVGKRSTCTPKLEILGFVKDLSLPQKGLSGTRALLSHHLNSLGFVRHLIDVKTNFFIEKLNLIRNFDFNVNRWSFNRDVDIWIRRIQTRIAERGTESFSGSFNSCFQIGSEFKVHHIKKLNSIPKFSYHDNNLMALIKGTPEFCGSNRRVKQAFQFEKDVYDHLDAIFTMTDFVRKSFIEDFFISEKKVFCVGFGANISYEKFSRDYDCSSILFVAKDSFEKKGGNILLEAFKKVKKNRKDIRLFIVGQDLKIDIDGVEVIGFIDKRIPGNTARMKSLYRRASLFVMPSYVEAAGNVFLEAMANKTPCIGADRGATPEIILHNNCGEVIEPGNSEELADKMIELLKDKERLRIMGENGFNTILNKYNWNVVCKKITSIMGKFL